MRLSAYVAQHGVDAFNREDFLFVSHQVAKAHEPMILVGGQALETWGLFFDVLAPTGDRHPLTEDTDWLGSKRDAQWLCEQLGLHITEIKFAGDTDNTVNTAYAYLQRPDGRVVMMDFLRAIVGPSNDDVRRLAVPVRVDGEVTLYILHPLLCLESRMANLAQISSKRRGNGPMQAVWAVQIVEAYLRSVVTKGTQRDAISACHRVAELAEYKSGRYCWLHFPAVDPLQAVSEDVVAKIGGRFETDDWPRTLNRIATKRARWTRMQRAGSPREN